MGIGWGYGDTVPSLTQAREDTVSPYPQCVPIFGDRLGIRRHGHLQSLGVGSEARILLFGRRVSHLGRSCSHLRQDREDTVSSYPQCIPKNGDRLGIRRHVQGLRTEGGEEGGKGGKGG